MQKLTQTSASLGAKSAILATLAASLTQAATLIQPVIDRGGNGSFDLGAINSELATINGQIASTDLSALGDAAEPLRANLLADLSAEVVTVTDIADDIG